MHTHAWERPISNDNWFVVPVSVSLVLVGPNGHCSLATRAPRGGYGSSWIIIYHELMRLEFKGGHVSAGYN